jgi:hypothetical protein
MAQALDPSIGHVDYGNFAYHVGLEDITEREYKKHFEIDPTNEFGRKQYVIYLGLVNRWDDYLAAKEKYLPNDPIDAFYYLAKGDLATARRLIEAQGNTPDGIDPDYMAVLLALEGNKKDSEALVPQIVAKIDRRRPDYHHTTYDIACVYAINGNVPEAMKWLRETESTGNPAYTLFNRDPFLDKIRRSPEFVKFMEELKPQFEKYKSELR